MVKVRMHNGSDVTLAFDETDRIINNIDAFALGDFKDCLLPSRSRIVDDEVGTTHSFRDLEFSFCTSRCNYTRTKCYQTFQAQLVSCNG